MYFNIMKSFRRNISTTNLETFSQILNQDSTLATKLIRRLNHQTKLQIVDEILGSKMNGKEYTSFIAGRHRRAITVREVSLSLNPEKDLSPVGSLSKQADTNSDGVISPEELEIWLRNLSKESKVETKINEKNMLLSNKQKRQLFIISTIPFVGFGFLDNAVMIVAGDLIEEYFGVFLGLSTLAAAGLGNLLSDVVGLIFGDWVEQGAKKLGVKDPKLSLKQMNLRTTKRIQLWGSLIGIVVGCLFGMLPLLFIDTHKEKETIEQIRAAA
eukprot:maker-scaffold_21-snap-gene-3.10-mRNA-1 protein AED:0.28 eAED:0.28 QI:88/1/1/1/1/1/2/163/269